MRKVRLVRELSACALAVVVAGAAPAALSDEHMPRQGMYGSGMMGGSGPYGPGFGSGYGPGMMGPGGGYGPGMMGPGYRGGCQPGMMDPGYGGGYGPGMMGRGSSYGPGMMMRGYGPGMMGPGQGGGYGPGMMGPGYGGGYVPEWGAGGQRLTDQQRDRLRDVQGEQHDKQVELMQKMQERQRELYRLQLADEPNYEAIKQKSREIGNLQQKMAEERIEAHKRMEKALGAD